MEVYVLGFGAVRFHLFILIVALTVLGYCMVSSIVYTGFPLGNDYDLVANKVWEKWLYAYSMVTELSRANINVTKYILILQESLDLLNRGECTKADSLLDGILPELENLYSQKDKYVFWSNIRKYGLAALIGSVPVFFYFFFPRIYLWIWYKTREKWVVEE